MIDSIKGLMQFPSNKATEECQENLVEIAKRIYFEGASSFNGKDTRAKVFMAQAWALRTLRYGLYGGSSYSWITENAFSVGTKKDSEQWIYDNEYIEMTFGEKVKYAAVEIFCHEFEASTDSKSYKYWIFNDAAGELNDSASGVGAKESI